MASFNKFNCFVQDVAHALHDMLTGTSQVYKIYLTNTAPVATNTVYNTSADLATSNGYTAGGNSIGTITGGQTSGTFRFIGGTDPQWTYLSVGALIIVAVAIDQWIRKVSA